MNEYEKLTAYLRETGVVKSCRRLLSWDRDTYMPGRGVELRATQIAFVAGLEHRRKAAPTFRGLIEAAAAQAGDEDRESPVAANLREARYDHDRATRVPPELIEELARTSTLAEHAWIDARERNDFKAFEPWLEKAFGLARQLADALGWEQERYDALLGRYERDETTAHLEEIFAPLREATVDLLRRIVAKGQPVDPDLLRGEYPVGRQERLALQVAQAVGFDFNRGRLDLTVHPFCSGFGPTDVRITTRWDECSFLDGLSTVLHEAGHGIYEQGLDPDHFGEPLGQDCSLGIHESQSRLWENFVGRSEGFWRHFHKIAADILDGLGEIGVEDLWRAINVVRPSFIRVDADEVTYNLHIFLRFELERALVNGDLDVADVPQAWNDRFTEIFDVTPPTDREGCLQDVHWSGCMVGYFPTYTLGNLYAAQLFARANEELGDLDEAFSRGEFTPLMRWMNENIHAQGRRYTPHRLIEVATGAPPSPDHLIRHLNEKYGAVYGL